MAILGGDVQETTLNIGPQGAPLIPANPDRRSVMIQNQGPGNVWVSPRNHGGNHVGFELPPLGALTDEPPCEHFGEWWVVTDANATVVQWAEEGPGP